MKKNLDKNKSNLSWVILILIYLFIATVPVLISSNKIINFSDHSFPFDFLEYSKKIIYTWGDNLTLGADQSLTQTPSLAYYLLFAFLQIISIPLWIINKLEFIIPLFLSMVGMTLLVKEVLNTKKKLVLFISSFSFVSSFIFISTLGQGLSQIIMSFAQIPLIIWAVIRLSKSSNPMYFIVLIISSLLLSSSNISYTIVGLATIILFLLIYSAINLDRKLFKYTGLFLILFILVNSFWIVPAGYTTIIKPYGISGITSQQEKLEGYTEIVSKRYDLSSILYLVPNIDVLISQNGNSSLLSFYNLLIVKLCFFILIILTLIYSLISKINKKLTISLIILFLIGIFMFKGVNIPFGGSYSYLMGISFFKVMREPLKWLILSTFSFSIMLGLLCDKIKNNISRLPILLILILLFCPYITGIFGVLQGYNVPNYYYNFVNEKKYQDGKLFVLNSVEDADKFEWDPTNKSTNVLKYMSSLPTVDQFSPALIRSKDFLTDAYSNISGNDKDLKYFSIMNVKEAVLQNDRITYSNINYNYSSKYFNYSKYGKLMVYEVKDEYFYPILFMTDIRNTTAVNLEKENYDNLDLYGSGYNFNSYNNVSSKYTNLTFVKLNPTEYSITVTNCTYCTLIFLNSYSPHWKLSTISPMKNFSYHRVIVNNYANGWIINISQNNETQESNKVTLRLNYLPQSYFNMGLIISGITVLSICILYLIYYYIKNRKAQKP